MKTLIKDIKDNQYQQHELDLSVDDYNNSNDILKITYDELYQLVIALNHNQYVKKINLTNQDITDNMVMLLINLKNIEDINLTGCSVTVLGANLLAKSHFKAISLCGTAIFYDNAKHCFFEEMITNFANNKSIISLNLLYLEIPSKMIAYLIENNTTIQKFYAPRDLQDDALKTLKHNNVIKELIIDENQLTDIGVKYIADNITLSKIFIDKSKITNNGAAILAKCNHLEELTLRDSDLNPCGVNYFLNSNISKVVIFNASKHNLLSYEFLDDFEILFQHKQQQKLIEQKEYYYHLTGNYINNETISHIQSLIDAVQKQEELNLIGNDNYWN